MPSFQRPWSWSLVFISLLIFLVGLSVRPRRWLFFIPLACICVYLIAFTKNRTPLDDLSYGGMLCTILFDASDLLVLRDVQKEIRKEGQKAGEIENKPFVERLKWSASLMVSPRSIGWIDPLASRTRLLRPAPTDGRGRFVLRKIGELAMNIVLLDVVGIFNRASPCFSKNGLSAGEAGFFWRMELLIGFASFQILLLNTIQSVLCIIFVGAGLSEPRHWPALFGSFLEAYSVRRLWGQSWQQNLRRIVTSHSNFVIKKLRLAPRGILSSCITSLIAFFISSVIHFASDFMIYKNLRSGGSFTFFMIQPLAIMFEVGVQKVFQKMGIRFDWRIQRAAGYVWVLLWFAYTLPIMLEPWLRSGTFESGPNFSLILGILRGEWLPKV